VETVKIKILFQGIFREIVQEKELSLKVDDNCSVAFILELISKKYGEDFKNITDPETGKISNEFLIILNGKGIRSTDIILEDRDVLMFTVPLGGG
jgi:hypothetical protein